MVYSFPDPKTAPEILEKSANLAIVEAMRINKIADTYKVVGKGLQAPSGTVFKIDAFSGSMQILIVRKNGNHFDKIEAPFWNYGERIEFLQHRQSILDLYADTVTAAYAAAKSAIEEGSKA